MRLRQHIYASVRGCEQQLPVVGGEGGAEIVLRLSEFGRLFIVCSGVIMGAFMYYF